MYNKSYRYNDPPLSFLGKREQKNFSDVTSAQSGQSNSCPPPSTKPKSSAAPLFSLFAKNKLKALDTDDYILMVLIFMLIKNSDEPDWPLVFSLLYILLDDSPA